MSLRYPLTFTQIMCAAEGTAASGRIFPSHFHGASAHAQLLLPLPRRRHEKCFLLLLPSSVSCHAAGWRAGSNTVPFGGGGLKSPLLNT